MYSWYFIDGIFLPSQSSPDAPMDANAQYLVFLLGLTLNFFEHIKNSVRLNYWLFWVHAEAEGVLGA